MSVKALQGILKISGLGASVDCIRNANTLLKLSSTDHYVSLSLLSPFLYQFQRLNPGFQYELKKSLLNQFESVSILFPYSIVAIDHCFNVCGIDAAFLDVQTIEGNHRKNLKRIVEFLPKNLLLMFKRCFIIGLSGRTLNNKMILFAFSIVYSESKDSYNNFFDFLKNNGV
jgi:hypothetical protein